MFVTAGILLEMLKSQGAASLAGYGVVIIDEVHERSCENDLSLACLIKLAQRAKELSPLKIILMSATTDVRRYSEFVSRLCDGGKPATYAIGESATVYNTTGRYLKDAIAEARFGMHLEYWEADPMKPFERHDRTAMQRISELIDKLTCRLVQRTIEEDGLGCTVLVFLPTYFAIEQAFGLLEESLPTGVPLYVLHSSVDMEDCMEALMGEDGARARGARDRHRRVEHHHQKGDACRRRVPLVRDPLVSPRRTSFIWGVG